jgi:hypothetical protein
MKFRYSGQNAKYAVKHRGVKTVRCCVVKYFVVRKEDVTKTVVGLILAVHI